MSNIVPFSELQQIARVMGANKIFGKTPEELLPLMLLAQAQGRHPAVVATEYDIIQGRPAINSKSALAKFQMAGGRVQWIERTDLKCSAHFQHELGGELTLEWTWEMSIKAGLSTKTTKDGSPNMWKKYPRQMLSARVIAEGVRAIFPACLDGLYLAEEAQDMEPIKAQPIKTEIEVTDPPKQTPFQEPFDIRVEKMFIYLLEQGLSEERILMRLAKPDRSQVDGYDLATVRELIKGAESLKLPIGEQFPEIKGVEIVELVENKENEGVAE